MLPFLESTSLGESGAFAVLFCLVCVCLLLFPSAIPLQPRRLPWLVYSVDPRAFSTLDYDLLTPDDVFVCHFCYNCLYSWSLWAWIGWWIPVQCSTCVCMCEDELYEFHFSRQYTITGQPWIVLGIVVFENCRPLDSLQILRWALSAGKHF